MVLNPSRYEIRPSKQLDYWYMPLHQASESKFENYQFWFVFYEFPSMITSKFMACDFLRCLLLLIPEIFFHQLCQKCPYSGSFWSTFSTIQSECRKIWTRKTPNTDTFHALILTINLIRRDVNKLFESRDKSELSCSSMLVIVTAGLRGRFGINCPSAFLKIPKLPE